MHKVILRHDVDNPIDYKLGRARLVANNVLLRAPWMRNLVPGYNRPAWEMLELDNRHNAKATWFFRTVTLPSKKMQSELTQHGHRIAYHADRDKEEGQFAADLATIQSHSSRKIQGVCKHGSAKVRGGGSWDEDRMNRLAKSQGLVYVCDGNNPNGDKPTHPDWQTPRAVNGIITFGHRITLYKHDWGEISGYVESHETPLVLIHPEDLTHPGCMEKATRLLSEYECVSVEDALGLGE
jgi:hypothetical protein